MVLHYKFSVLDIILQTPTSKYVNEILNIYRLSQEECARLREGVPYVKEYRYNPKHLCPKLPFGQNATFLPLYSSLYLYNQVKEGNETIPF
jgi:hypothetical protein